MNVSGEFLHVLRFAFCIIYLFNINNLSVFGSEDFFAREFASLHNRLAFTNRLERHTGCVESVPQCAKLCNSNPLCMSFFYKTDDLPICQLHSVVFTDTRNTQNAQGWLYYLLETDWCWTTDPSGFFLERNLSSCFRRMSNGLNYTQMTNSCKQLNASLLKLTSAEKETRLVQIIGHLWPTVTSYIIQGKYNGHWTFDDGTAMTYFNWFGTQQKSMLHTLIVLFLTNNGNQKVNSTWISGKTSTGKLNQFSAQTTNYICEKD